MSAVPPSPPEPLSCPAVEESLGALLLGSLDPAEREQVESHLRGCPACASVLAELAPLPGLLHRMDLPAADEPAPPEVLERALAQARAEDQLAARRRRRRWSVVAAAAVASVVAVVLAVSFLVPRPSSVTVSATDATTHVSASVVVTPTDSGTELALTLDGVPAGEHCQLVAVGRDGRHEVASTWIANYEGAAQVTGNTSLMRADLTTLAITTTDGTTLVTLPLPA